ncbi:MAG: phytanoyl-CoA dioxygenase family protein [Alphaproteobacteria bacterium]
MSASLGSLSKAGRTLLPFRQCMYHRPELSGTTLGVLPADTIAHYREHGYVVAPGAATRTAFAAMRAELDAWVEESRGHNENYGETQMGTPRFDLEPGHNAAVPRLRRVNNPAEISETYRSVAFDGPLAEMAADLVGPDVKFLHGKINLKLPGTKTRVDYHQDFAYVPHTNGDVVTGLLMLDDMTLENGCLMVVPGSHREGQASLWAGERFTGSVSQEKAAECARRAVPITGRAGDVCLMHAKLLHGSEPNASGSPRRLYICMYSAADAFLLQRNSLPNRFEGAIVRGTPTRRARLEAGSVELPEIFRQASFFQVQEAAVQS